MTDRDQFAAAAMSGLLQYHASLWVMCRLYPDEARKAVPGADPDFWAGLCYEMADAMLRARQSSPQPREV